MDQTLEQDRSSGTEVQQEELESEVKIMAEKILLYRKTLPEQLKSRLSAIVSAQIPPDPASEPGTSNPDSAEHVELEKGKSVVEDNEQTAERIHLLKHKILSNVSALPNALKRMNECISRMDKLESNNEVHPVFKRTKSY